MTAYRIGERYTHITKEYCYKESLKAIKQGYQVKHGITYTGNYFYEIVDPFKEVE